jgi:hypothetical protein
MTWFLALHRPPSAAEPCFTGSYRSLRALRIAVARLQEAAGGHEILFRFQTPMRAKKIQIDELRCLGLVNGETMDLDSAR